MRSSRKMWLFLGFGDLIHINLSFFVAYHLKFGTFQILEKYVALLFVFNFAWIVIASLFKLYQFSRVTYLETIIYNLVKANIIHLLVITSFLFSMKASTFSREQLMYTYLFSFFLIIIWRVFAVYVLKNYRKSGYNYINVIIVGSGSMTRDLIAFFESSDPHGYRLMGIFNDTQLDPDLDNIETKSLEGLEAYCAENKIDEIYYCGSIGAKTEIHNLIQFSDKNMIRFRIIPDFSSFLSRNINIDTYGSLPVITLREEPLQIGINRIQKRLFDIIFSFFIIVLLFPILIPLISIMIKCSSRGPVFFKQLRSGIDNHQFTCYKFRTMQVNKLADEKQAVKNDPRVTKLGLFLRKTNLDEFPQFLNVFFGDMSIVGPRPHMLKHTNEYSKLIDDYMVRQLVKPGITGPAQVYGFRGEIKNIEEIKGRVKLDVWYIENWSLLLDFKMVFLTIFNMLKGEDSAY